MITTDDREALRELFARLADALDRGDEDAYVAGYAPDGVFHATGVPEAPGGEVLARGTEALRGFVRTVAAGTRGGQRHWNENFVFSPGEDGAVVVDSYLTTFQAGPAPHARVLLTGRYRDTVVQRDGRWLVRERRLTSDVAVDG